MKLLIRMALSIPFLVSSVADAEVASDAQLIRLARATGIYEQIEAQKNAIRAQGEQAARKYAQQIVDSRPGLPAEFAQDLEKEMQIYMFKISNIVDTEFAIKTYIQLISKKLTSNEVDDLVTFYESELGRKFTMSNTEITSEWTTTFMGDFDKKMMTYLQEYVQNLMAKVSQYNQ